MNDSHVGGRSRFGLGSLVLLATIGMPIACGDDDEDLPGGSGGSPSMGGATSGGRAAGGRMSSSGGTTDGGSAGNGSGATGGFAQGGATGGEGGSSGTGGDRTLGGSAGAGAAAGAGNGGGPSSGGGGSGSGAAGPEMGGAGSGTSGGAGGTFAGRTPRIVCPADAGGGGGGGGGALPDGDGPPYFDRGGATSDLDFEFNVTSLGGDVVPVALNASGQAVVKIEETFGSAEACRSFLIDASNSHEILVPGGSSCVEAIDVNDAGRVVGQLHPSLEAFLWQGGVASVLDSALGRPVAINNQNRVIFDSGVLWDAGIVTVLTLSDDMRLIPKAINNLGQIVGPFLDNRAALWEDGNISEIPMDWPEAINDLGHVLGVRDFNVGVWNGVTFRAHGSMMDVSTSRPMALNNHDEFVGTRDESPGDFPAYPFVAQGPQFTPLELAGIAVDINDSGDILGERHTTQTTRTGVLVLSRAARIWSRRGHCPAACCP